MLQETAVNKTLSGGMCVQCGAEDSRPSTLWSHWAVHLHSISPPSFPARDRITLLSSLPVDVATWLASHDDTGAGECMSLPGGAFESQWISSPATAVSSAARGRSAITWAQSEGCEQRTHDGRGMCMWDQPSKRFNNQLSREGGEGWVYKYGVCVWCVCMFIRNFADIKNAIYKE